MKNYKNIKKALLGNEKELLNIVREINNYNGSLDHLNFYENDEEFFNTFFYNDPKRLAMLISYGDYRYHDDYVRFNGYGNLESFDEYELMKELKYYIDDIIDSLKNCWKDIYITDDDILQALEDAEE